MQQFPQEAFLPKWDAQGDHWREYLSLYSANGIPGASVKSDWGLARVTPQNYADNFCLYRISTSKVGLEGREILGPTYVDPRENSANLDAHITFSEQTSSTLVVLLVYHDSLELGHTDVGERDIVLNYWVFDCLEAIGINVL